VATETGARWALDPRPGSKMKMSGREDQGRESKDRDRSPARLGVRSSYRFR